MKAEIYIGIDMGSTGLKAVAFEAGSGAVQAACGEALPIEALPAGGCELEARAIERSLMQTLRGVAMQLGPRVREVRAIGCTGHGAGLYALDDEGRLPGGRAVASTDRRADGRARALAERAHEALFQQVGCGAWPGQPTLIAAALFEARPAWRRPARRLLFAKDYLAYLLTAEIASDASDASTAGLLSLADGGWSAAAFEGAGLGLDDFRLPPLVPSGTAIGRLRPQPARDCGLPAGIAVATGAIDLLASLKAVGAQESGQAVAVLGTWCVNAAVGPLIEPKPAVGAVVRFDDTPRRLYLENSPSSMANIAWLARTLRLPDTAAVVDCAMSQPLGASGVRFMPFIHGGGTPAHARAGFVGLKAHHDHTHMARAAVDAVMALHALHIDRLRAHGLGARDPVMALGGGARDARLVRLLASFLGQPVARCGDDETGARGAALYAAQSQGVAGTARGIPPARARLLEPQAGQARAHADFRAEFAALVADMAPAFARCAGAAR